MSTRRERRVEQRRQARLAKMNGGSPQQQVLPKPDVDRQPVVDEVTRRRQQPEFQQNLQPQPGPEELTPTGTPTPQQPQQDLFQGAIQTLSPESQGVANAFTQVAQQQQQSLDQGIDSQNAMIDARNGQLDQQNAQSEAFFQDQEDLVRQQSEERRRFMEIEHEQQMEFNEEREIEQLKQIRWEEDKQARELERSKSKQVDQITAEIALRGGFGSSNALAGLRETERLWDIAIDDMRTQMGFRRDDLSAQYTQLFMDLESNYRGNVLNEMQTLESRIAEIDLAEIQDRQARETAHMDAISEAMGKIDELRREKSEGIYQYVKDISDLIGKEQDYQWEQQKQQLQRQEGQILGFSDTADQVESLTSRILSHPTYKSVNDVMLQVDRVKQARVAWENAKGTAGEAAAEGAYETALVFLFMKSLDPGSVVRESEFQSVISGQGWSLDRLQEIFDAGQGIEDEEGTRQLESQIEALESAALNAFARDMTFIPNRVSWWNGNPNVQEQIDPTLLPGFEFLPLDKATNDSIGNWVKDWDFDVNGGGAVETTLPPTQSKVQTSILGGNGIVTGYGSDLWANGLDIWAPKGTVVKAHIGGQVIQVDGGYINDTDRPDPTQKNSFGNRVKVLHDDGTEAWYSHLDQVLVAGDRIEAGGNIGTVGNTGSTYGRTGVHLDLTIKRDGQLLSARDAARWINTSPIS